MDQSKPNLKKFIHHYHFDVLDSTMNKSLEFIDQYPDGLVVTANKQNLGRGRNGKTYLSDNNDGLWCTLGLEVKNQAPFNYIKKFSVALCRYLQAEHNVPAKIKWPNDIFVHNKKLCGLLAEFPTNQKTLLLGFGLNVNQESFPDPIKEIAISIRQITNKKLEDLNLFLQEILLSFESALEQKDDLIDELYKENALIWNCEAYLDDEVVFVYGISSDGTISIRKNGKQISVSAGELRPLTNET